MLRWLGVVVGRRGQIALMGMMAFALMVAVVLYLQYSRGSAETEVRQHELEAETDAGEAVKLDVVLTKSLEDATFGACEELALHGGYRREHLPFLRHGPTPYWFVRGNVSTIPSLEQVTHALKKETWARLAEAIKVLDKEITDLTFGTPEVNVRYADENRITTTVSVDVTDAQERTTRMDITVDLPVRLLLLRRLAEEYVKGHQNGRRLEKSLGHLIIEDPRIFSPNSPPEFGCQEETVTVDEIRLHLQENMVLTVSEELSLVRESELQQSNIQWSLDHDDEDLIISLLDQRGNTDRVVKEVTSFGAQCFRVWKAFYNVTLPIRVTVMDTQPISRVRGESVLTARPLEFKVAVELAIADNVPFEGPSLVSPLCKGQCSLDLTLREGDVEGDAPVFLGPCLLGDASGEYRDIPCGTHTLHVAKESFAPAELTVNLHPDRAATVELVLAPFSSLAGSVSRRNRVYCTRESCAGQRDRVVEEGLDRIGYVKGNPPSFVTIVVAALATGEEHTAVVDEGGNFKIDGLVPGDYVIIADPNKDSMGNTAFKVQTFMGSVRIEPGTGSLYDIVMEPLVPVQVDGKWEFVTRTDACC